MVFDAWSPTQLQEMGYVHINWVRKHSQTRGAARLLLLALAIRAGDDNLAWPNLDTLAADANMDKRSVRRALDEIPGEELAVEKGGSPKGQKRKVAKYRLLMPKAALGTNKLASRRRHQKPGGTGGTTSPVRDRGPDVPGAAPQTRDKNAPTGDKIGQKPGTPRPPTLHRLTKERAESPSIISGDSTFPTPVSAPDPKTVFSIVREEEAPPVTPKKQSKSNGAPQQKETKEQQIQRLKAAFLEVPLAEIDRAATEYQNHLNEQGQKWDQFPNRFDRIITELSFHYRPTTQGELELIELDRIAYEGVSRERGKVA
jgi:hypothetical protein